MVTFNRFPYSGLKDALVIAIDVGTTFSGVSYTILRPDQRPEVYSVVGFKGQEDQSSNTKVPTVLYYDQTGKLCACGSEAATGLQEGEDYIKVEWFKILLRPKELANPPAGMPVIQLPSNRSVVDVLSDFLGYMNRCAQEYIIRVHSDGNHIWSSLGTEATYILTHPNGWEGFQQGQMREAAVRGGLVPDTPEGRGRIQFLTEGEASFHWCVDIGLTGPETLSEGSHIIVADAGGGTIDVSSYEVLSIHPLRLKERGEAQCELAGSIFVTASFKEKLKELLESSLEFDDDEYVERGVEEFDRKTKCLFEDPGKPSFIKLGTKRQNEPSLNIRGGQLKLTGDTIATTFKHSCDGTVNAISSQLTGSTEATVFLVGGFAASPWLYKESKRRLGGVFRRANINLKRADSHTAKAVAHGAVAWYLDRLVTARVAKHTYGTDYLAVFNRSDEEHRSRSHLCTISDASGLMFIGPLFRALVTKGEAIQTDSVFRKSFNLQCKHRSDALHTMTLDRYDGDIGDIDFYEKDQGSFTTVCQMPIKLPAAALEPCLGLKGLFWHLTVEIVLSLGETELQCHVEWEEEGEKK
ncbi:hypothetical protein FRB99_001857, partial [Tulasnella sp. 403]